MEYFVYYDDLNKNFYFKVGVLVDINGDPFEGANAYVIINNTKYYSITDKMGYVNFTISSQNVSIDDLNDRHTITFQKDGYDKVEFIINVRY